MNATLTCKECGNVKTTYTLPNQDSKQSYTFSYKCDKCGSAMQLIKMDFKDEVEINFQKLKESLKLMFKKSGINVTFGKGFETSQPIGLQAVVELGEKTNEGSILTAVTPVWYKLCELLEKDPNSIYSIPPRQMEEMIAGWYTECKLFDEVILTPRSGDRGRDVIAIKKGVLQVRIIDSVKRYAKNRLVSADEVRSLVGVLSGERNTSKGIVTTTSSFAPRIAEDPFIAPFMPYRLELVNGEQLIERLTSIVRPVPARNIAMKANSGIVKHPR